MKSIFDRLFTHWKSTLLALIIATVTVQVAMKVITPEQWVLMIGGVATLWGLFKKDNDI
jgi:hypothetical protein